jgi:pilus assembly protein CpaD
MNTTHSLCGMALALLVGACAPVTTYTDAEASKNLKLDSATTQLGVRFAPGSAVLAAADAARLRALGVTGGIAPSDRVMVAAAGAPYLARQRIASIASVLLRYGIVVVADQLPNLPSNGALIEVGRTLVTLPPCPNWSKPTGTDFGNQPSSNFGCATETDLGMMVANPSDLASGLPVGPAVGQPSVSAVTRYLTDKVELPSANTGLPIAQQSSPSPGGSGPGSGTGSNGSQ